MIQITEDKKAEMSELCEKMLHYGGKLMQCIENMSDESGMGMRGYGMGMRQDGGNRYGMGMRYDESGMGMRGYGMRDDHPTMMGERNRDSYGRYTR